MQAYVFYSTLQPMRKVSTNGSLAKELAYMFEESPVRDDSDKETSGASLVKSLASVFDESPMRNNNDKETSSTLLARNLGDDKETSGTSLANGLASILDEFPMTYENDKETSGTSLTKGLASLLDESCSTKEMIPIAGMELKRFIETRIKKKVKEQYTNGMFHDLMTKVIANPDTLQNAYDCIRLNSNVDITLERDDISFQSIARELISGCFNIRQNTFSISISAKGVKKEALVLPNLKLRVVQEAIRVVLEVVYRPHFSKISHGCRSGRGHRSAHRYICKEIKNASWWFKLHVKKKANSSILGKLISTMQEKIEDPNLYSILQSMLDAKVLNLEFGGFPKGQGLPQEGILSPILMNIYLGLFDEEIYRTCFRYEALRSHINGDLEKKQSKLRFWFRRQLKDGNKEDSNGDISSLRLHACRFMDEIFVATSGSKETAIEFKSELQDYLQNSLHLDVDETDILAVDTAQYIQFLGLAVRMHVEQSPSVKIVHKLKQKVQLFASQKQDIWDSMSFRIGKKCLGHGLKRVKESEIKHLADSNSILNQISRFRKDGMKTDHWFKALLKIWMQDVNAKAERSKEVILTKYISEPALPSELRESFYNFQKHAEEYVSSETFSTLALLHDSSPATAKSSIQILAPISVIEKKLVRYGLLTGQGYPKFNSALILQDNIQIIDWYKGLVRRWLRLYRDCSNFSEVKLMIIKQVRVSCLRTLAAKHRMRETETEKKFESELNGIPSTEEIELEIVNEMSDSQVFDDNEALTYGVSYSGLCLLSLARIASPSQPCNCSVVGCLAVAPCIYTLHVKERQKYPGWMTGFLAASHPSLNGRRIGLCRRHVKDLYMGHISLQSIDFERGNDNFLTYNSYSRL